MIARVLRLLGLAQPRRSPAQQPEYPRVHVSRHGVSSARPSDILRSLAGQREIAKARAAAPLMFRTPAEWARSERSTRRDG